MLGFKRSKELTKGPSLFDEGVNQHTIHALAQATYRTSVPGGIFPQRFQLAAFQNWFREAQRAR